MAVKKVYPSKLHMRGMDHFVRNQCTYIAICGFGSKIPRAVQADLQQQTHQSNVQEVNLQNENAWADLGNTDAADDGEADEAEVGMEGDNLWDEFKSREQEEEQRVNYLATCHITC